MNTASGFAASIVVVISAVTPVWAHSSNPPIGMTGAQGEPTCAAIGCHDQYPLNSGPGDLNLN